MDVRDLALKRLSDLPFESLGSTSAPSHVSWEPGS